MTNWLLIYKPSYWYIHRGSQLVSEEFLPFHIWCQFFIGFLRGFHLFLSLIISEFPFRPLSLFPIFPPRFLSRHTPLGYSRISYILSRSPPFHRFSSSSSFSASLVTNDSHCPERVRRRRFCTYSSFASSNPFTIAADGATAAPAAATA